MARTPQTGDIISIHRRYTYGGQSVYSGTVEGIRDDGAILLAYRPHAGTTKTVTSSFPTDPTWLKKYQVSSQTVTIAE